MAGRLAADGVACLRFDYHGTGDSEGDDADFSPDLALSDIVCAATELRRRVGDHPLVLMGIRASAPLAFHAADPARRSEEHTSELQSLMRISYAVFCLKKKTVDYYTDNKQ